MSTYMKGNLSKQKAAAVGAAVATAALLWAAMFSPWTAPHLNFWWAMTFSAIVLRALATLFCPEWRHDLRPTPTQIAAGIALAALLWGVFWTGDKVSQWLFGFARQQVDLIYSMKTGTSPTVIALLLLFIIGPAEEIFWRGFIQRRLSQHWNLNIGFIATLALYTFIHIWALNLMLLLAAFVVGFCWGAIYRLCPQSLTALIISHAIWDTCAFVLFPF